MKLSRRFAIIGLGLLLMLIALLTGGCTSTAYVGTSYYVGPDPFLYPYYCSPNMVIINRPYYHHGPVIVHHPRPVLPPPHHIKAPIEQRPVAPPPIHSPSPQKSVPPSRQPQPR